ncbi:MAG: hypothetical protein ACLT76_10855 [Clostridium fessum]
MIGENIFFELDGGSRRRSGAAGSWNVFDLEEPQIRLQINKTVKKIDIMLDMKKYRQGCRNFAQCGWKPCVGKIPDSPMFMRDFCFY